MQLSLHIEEWPAKIPFRITGLVRESFRLIVVELAEGGCIGRGEGMPVHYLRESAETLYRQVESLAPRIEHGIERMELLELMPAGGARKAIDCALWDLEAKRSGRSIWELTGIVPRPLTTTFTIGMEESPEEMAVRARDAASYPILKIKVDADRPVERVAAIRQARPDAQLVVDANQGWSFEQLRQVAPQLALLGVTLIEQPLPRGADEQLEEYVSPVPLCADESCQHRGELAQARRRYQIVNIKLDKAGGLTEALLLAQDVNDAGLQLLASNMCGTSLSMAPTFVLAQVCQYVEIDGHLLLAHDRFPDLECQQGTIRSLDPCLWG